jgi:hypothetical protein
MQSPFSSGKPDINRTVVRRTASTIATAQTLKGWALTMIRAFLYDVDLVAGCAEIPILTVADAALQARTMPGTVATSQTYHLIANNTSEPRITNTPPRCCARTVPRAPARAVRLLAGGAFPARVADAVSAALADSMAAAVVQLLASYDLIAMQAGEAKAAVCGVVRAPDLLQRVCVGVADLVHRPHR